MKKWKNWAYSMKNSLILLLLNRNEETMLIKLYAIEIMEGTIKFSELPFSDKIKQRIKNYLAKMVEDDELLAELTKEKE